MTTPKPQTPTPRTFVIIEGNTFNQSLRENDGSRIKIDYQKLRELCCWGDGDECRAIYVATHRVFGEAETAALIARVAAEDDSKRTWGFVDSFNSVKNTPGRGTGFIVRREKGKNVGVKFFVHHSQIESDGYRTLHDDEKVSFKIIKTGHGFSATEVRPFPGYSQDNYSLHRQQFLQKVARSGWFVEGSDASDPMKRDENTIAETAFILGGIPDGSHVTLISESDSLAGCVQKLGSRRVTVDLYAMDPTYAPALSAAVKSTRQNRGGEDVGGYVTTLSRPEFLDKIREDEIEESDYEPESESDEISADEIPADSTK